MPISARLGRLTLFDAQSPKQGEMGMYRGSGNGPDKGCLGVIVAAIIISAAVLPVGLSLLRSAQAAQPHPPYVRSVHG